MRQLRHKEDMTSVVGWVCVLLVDLAAAQEKLTPTVPVFRQVGQHDWTNRCLRGLSDLIRAVGTELRNFTLYSPIRNQCHPKCFCTHTYFGTIRTPNRASYRYVLSL
jgi:hypothetical protein